MLSFLILCHVWILHTAVTRCRDDSTGIQLSVPEDHHIRLKCSGSDGSHMVWTHQGKSVLVARHGDYETNVDPERYHLDSDGSLVLQRLEESDNGDYHCNQRLEAQVQVLTGCNFTVSAGRTLLLPCRGSSRLKHRWFHRRRPGGRRELIFTCFGNRAVEPEREEGRLRCEDEALHIQDLQPGDAGEYLCNGYLQARLSVLTVQPEPTSRTSRTRRARRTTTPDVIVTEEKKKRRRRSENVLLMVAVVGLGLMILFLVVVCVFLSSRRCRRERKLSRTASQQQEDTELQPWETSITQSDCGLRENRPLPEETVHYASLGRQSWRERPSRTPLDQNHHKVIYSSVITRPAAR